MKHTKFIYPDLAINTDILNKEDNEIEKKNRFINFIVVKHFGEIIGYGNNINTLGMLLKNVHIDYESEKQDSYQQGYNDAKEQFQKTLEERQKNINFEFLLQNKIENIESNVNIIKKDIITLGINFITQLVKKLCLVLKVDFEQILLTYMMTIIEKFYKNGKVVILVHEDRIEYCEKLLMNHHIPKEIKENIQVLVDNTLDKEDCKVKWHNTELCYTKNDIVLNVENMMNQLIELTN